MPDIDYDDYEPGPMACGHEDERDCDEICETIRDKDEAERDEIERSHEMGDISHGEALAMHQALDLQQAYAE